MDIAFLLFQQDQQTLFADFLLLQMQCPSIFYLLQHYQRFLRFHLVRPHANDANTSLQLSAVHLIFQSYSFWHSEHNVKSSILPFPYVSRIYQYLSFLLPTVQKVLIDDQANFLLFHPDDDRHTFLHCTQMQTKYW